MKAIRPLACPYILFVLTALFLSACQSIPEGVETVPTVELERYTGTWYEIKRLDNGFEKHLSQVTATYDLQDDGSIRVVNRGYDTVKNKWNDVAGKARLREEGNSAELEVSFFGPFYSGYNIIALDTANYNHALVCGADKDYLWMLSRTTEMPDSVLRNFESIAEAYGFDVASMVKVKH